MYKFYRVTPIGRRSDNIDKWGEVAHSAKREITFVNTETGLMFTTDDLVIKKSKRLKALQRLYNFYKTALLKKQASSILYIVNVKSIANISNHIKNLKRKFNKKQIQLLAYYWQRDIGEKEFQTHYHFILILSRINTLTFKKLFRGYSKSNARAVFCDSLKSFKGYLGDKEFFAPHRKRNYSLSKKLVAPTIN